MTRKNYVVVITLLLTIIIYSTIKNNQTEIINYDADDGIVQVVLKNALLNGTLRNSEVMLNNTPILMSMLNVNVTTVDVGVDIILMKHNELKEKYLSGIGEGKLVLMFTEKEYITPQKVKLTLESTQIIKEDMAYKFRSRSMVIYWLEFDGDKWSIYRTLTPII